MTEIELDEDPRRDALRCIQCEFRADDTPGGWYEASEHVAAGHRVDRIAPLDREPLTGSQPDPLVVMWMRQYLRERPTLPVVNSIAVNPKVTTIRAWVTAHGTGSLSSTGRSLRELSAAYEVARKALLPRVDIPAGQGPASLFVRRGKDGHQALLFQPDDGEPVLVMWETMPDPAMDALWEHLAGTLRVLTDEDAP